MKIIDLLNKIANDEEIPKHIRYDGKDFKLFKSRGRKMYCCISDNELFDGDVFDDTYNIMLILNDEIEIIEDKKIEKLKLLQFSDLIDMDLDKRIDVIKENRNKINEIIDKLNEGE